ncbi:unnamed protein product [Gongylonema pulchrum]|uniref:DUF4158 domain-containing protein n=1 Tax=Gongylonema pulchrum TaxID=637853 RepID=A0A183EWA5_9BILA|nr:unnamed protein product [Gongylonema pulchrum]
MTRSPPPPNLLQKQRLISSFRGQTHQEQFIGLLAKAAYGQATFDKRKTLQFKDLGTFAFCFRILHSVF